MVRKGAKGEGRGLAVTVARNSQGRFALGNPGGPGRAVGSRNKLTEDFLAKLQADFAEHGVSVIERVRREMPHRYLECVADLVPRQHQVEHNNNVLTELSDE